MKSEHGQPPLNRRRFLRQTGLGTLAVTTGLAVSARLGRAAQKTNPFAYDLERFSKTDPKLIAYEQLARFPCPGAEPRRIAVGPEARVYIAAKDGISVLDHSGIRERSIPLPEPARCVGVAADGAVYVGLRNHVEVFDSKGRRLAAWESPGPKTWLTGLAVGENDVFAADSGNRVVLRFDKSGKLAGRIGEKNKDRNVPGLIVPSPYLDVDLGRDGLLRVNNPGRHCIEAYTVSGDLEVSWGKPSAAIEGFCGCCNPVALTLLSDGRCVTCEKGLPRVKVHAADGSFESVVAGPESFPENAKVGSLHDRSDGSVGGLDAAVDAQGKIYVLDLVQGDVRVMQRRAS